MCGVWGVSLSPPLVDSTKRNVSRRNTTKALQKDFRRLEEIYDQKRHKSLPSVGNFNCSVICSSVLCCFNKFVDHGGRRGDTAQALARWRHPVASSEALDVLYRLMCPASYCCIVMAIEIASNLPSFLSSPISLSPTTIANKHSNSQFKLKPS